jgi:NAD(P)-dependent dehydrogenase (short-subunit alcohol dehydrogenase family)
MVDVSSREQVEALVAEAKKFGDITGFIHAAGVSPSQASPETILKVTAAGWVLAWRYIGLKRELEQGFTILETTMGCGGSSGEQRV